jgi:murein DD-endopeptidase MepM/ murein hydrolase activator NlpD
MAAHGMPDVEVLSSQARQKELIQRKLAVDAVKKRLSGGKDGEAELREACKGFESIFLKKLWKEMRDSVPNEGYLHSKHEEFYLSMFDQQLAENLADAGGIGLGDMLYRQLKQQADRASRVTSPSRALNSMPIKTMDEAPQGTLDTSETKTELIRTPPSDLNRDALYAPYDDSTGPEEARQAGSQGQDQGDEAGQAATGPSIPLTPGAVAADQASRNAARAAAPESLSEELNIPDPLAEELKAIADDIEKRGGAAAREAGGPAPARAADPASRVRPVSLPDMRWPVDGEPSSDFGWRKDPFTGERAWHAGVDIAADFNTPVKACWDGKVVFSGRKGGYGNMVVLEHPGGWRSYYAHNSRNTVQPGDTIRAGEKIATVGSTGRSTGPHLHFELRQSGLAWNPHMIQQRLAAGLTIGRHG